MKKTINDVEYSFATEGYVVNVTDEDAGEVVMSVERHDDGFNTDFAERLLSEQPTVLIELINTAKELIKLSEEQPPLKVVVEMERDLANMMKAHMSKETDQLVSDISDEMLITECIWNSDMFDDNVTPNVPDKVKVTNYRRD